MLRVEDFRPDYNWKEKVYDKNRERQVPTSCDDPLFPSLIALASVSR